MKRTEKWIIRKRNATLYPFFFHNWDTKTKKFRWVIWPPGSPSNVSWRWEFYTFEEAIDFVNNKIYVHKFAQELYYKGLIPAEMVDSFRENMTKEDLND